MHLKTIIMQLKLLHSLLCFFLKYHVSYLEKPIKTESVTGMSTVYKIYLKLENEMFKLTTHIQSVQQSNNYKFSSADVQQPSKFVTGVNKIPESGHLYNFNDDYD